MCSTNPGKPAATVIDVDGAGAVRPLVRRAQQKASFAPAAVAATAELQQSVVVDADGATEATEESADLPKVSEKIPAELAKYMSVLENRIKEAWFLHGDSVLVVVDSDPYIISPSKDAAVKGPKEVLKELSDKKGKVLPGALAKAAAEKKSISFALWISDVPSLMDLANNFDEENVRSLSGEGKLRGFLKGEEQNEHTIKKLSKTELLGLGWSLTWLVGGLGRKGLLGQAAQAVLQTSESESLLQEAHTSSYYQEQDREWFRYMMRSTPTDGLDSLVASHAKDWLSALAQTSA